MESCVKQYAVPQFELLLHAQKLERELQQATAERDTYRAEANKAELLLDEAHMQADKTADALSARNNELVAALEVIAKIKLIKPFK